MIFTLCFVITLRKLVELYDSSFYRSVNRITQDRGNSLVDRRW